MITFDKPGDTGILFTALSNYAAALENCVRISKGAGPSFQKLAAEYEQTKKKSYRNVGGNLNGYC